MQIGKANQSFHELHAWRDPAPIFEKVSASGWADGHSCHSHLPWWRLCAVPASGGGGTRCGSGRRLCLREHGNPGGGAVEPEWGGSFGNCKRYAPIWNSRGLQLRDCSEYAGCRSRKQRHERNGRRGGLPGQEEELHGLCRRADWWSTSLHGRSFDEWIAGRNCQPVRICCRWGSTVPVFSANLVPFRSGLLPHAICAVVHDVPGAE